METVGVGDAQLHKWQGCVYLYIFCIFIFVLFFMILQLLFFFPLNYKIYQTFYVSLEAIAYWDHNFMYSQ